MYRRAGEYTLVHVRLSEAPSLAVWMLWCSFTAGVALAHGMLGLSYARSFGKYCILPS
jgi:hypothetical protein